MKRTNLASSGWLRALGVAMAGLCLGGGLLRGSAPEFPPAAAAFVAGDSDQPRPPTTWLEVQVELTRRGFSGGPIDGIRGRQSTAALAAFQRRGGLPDTGELDAATSRALVLEAPALIWASLAEEDLAGLHPVATTWLGKSEQGVLAHETALELAAERFRAGVAFLRRINPDVNWDALTPETLFVAPAAEFVRTRGPAARIEIRIEARVLEVFDERGRLIAHFPVSIARRVEKRPLGELRVTVAIPNPDYTFDPAVFTESAEARELGRKLNIPPGPNNPVGVAWIGLDRPGYGIHGTPDPAKVGHTESHGCFRLANWDAHTLLSLVWVGLPVVVQP